MEKKEHFYTVGESVNYSTIVEDKAWPFLKDLEIEIPFDPAIPLLGIYPKDYINRSTIRTHAHECSLQHCSQ